MIRIRKKNQSTKYFKLTQTMTGKESDEPPKNNIDYQTRSANLHLLHQSPDPISSKFGYPQQKSLRHTNAIIQKSNIKINSIRKLEMVKLNKTVSNLNKNQDEAQEEMTKQYQNCLINIVRINDLFRIGNFSKVYTANLTNRSDGQLVVKKIQVDNSHVSREQHFAKILKSPYIVQFLGTYHTFEIEKQKEAKREKLEERKENNGEKKYLNIVMKKYGNNLKEFLLSQKLEDKKLKIFLYQMIRGLNYLHSLQICHRDIKPHNFVIKKSCIYLCDFGAAKVIPNSDQINSISYIFSRQYRAPQLLLGFENYDLSVDIWALACVAAEMVLKKPLFNGTNNLDQIIKVLRVLGSPRWQTISFYKNRSAPKIPHIVGSGLSQALGENCNNMLVKLINRMLVIQPKERITALQALTDPYFDQIRQQSFFRCQIKPLGLPNLFYFNKRQTFGKEEYLGRLIPYWVKQHCKRFQIDLKDYNF